MHVLTIDLEEWFHLLDFDATRGEEQWSRYEVRIYENTERILTLLEDSGTKATFFVIGWIARQYPDLVRKIAEKYRLGTHTENHQLVWQQKPEEFKRDLVDSIHRLEDISGKRCEVFRAPGFSIRPSEAWVFDMLAESGIRYDSSIFPARASHGGWPGFPADGPVRIATRTSDIKEFPMPCRTLAGHPFVFSGGGYFRLFPYSLIRKWTDDSSYNLAYIHPRDLDKGQPVLQGLPPIRRFKSYYGLASAESKLRRYLSDFSFTDIHTAAETVDWEAVPSIIPTNWD